MVWSLLLLTFVIAQDKPAVAAADKPVPAVAAEADGPPLKTVTKGAGKAAAPAPANPPAAESPFNNIFIMFIPAILIFWMMFARPQRKPHQRATCASIKRPESMIFRSSNQTVGCLSTPSRWLATRTVPPIDLLSPNAI